MKTDRIYTQEDRQAYAYHKNAACGVIKRLEQASRENSKLIHQLGGHLKAVRDGDLHGIEGYANTSQWGQGILGLGERQAVKYIKIFTNLTLAEVSTLPGEVESLYQVALSRDELRQTVIRLITGDRLGYKAVQEGRRAAQRELKESKSMEAACAVAVRIAHEQAKRDDAEAESEAKGRRPKGGYDRSTAGEMKRMAAEIRALQKRIDHLLELLDQGEAVPGLAEMQAAMNRLLESYQRLVARLSPGAQAGGVEEAGFLRPDPEAGFPGEAGPASPGEGDGASAGSPEMDRRAVERETAPDASPGEAPPQPAQDDQDVDWCGPVARAVVAHLAPEEVPWVADQLALTLSGRPPAALLGKLREAGARMHEVPETVREDLGHWLRGAAHADLERRWPFLFDFFASAQLPGFHQDLHLLRQIDLPPPIREVLEQAWAYWPLPEDQPDLPADADELWAEARRLEHLLKRVMGRYKYIKSLGGEANTAAMSAAWEEAVDLKQELLRLQRALQPQP